MQTRLGLRFVPFPGPSMTTHSSILAWKIPWTEKPGSLLSMGSQRVRHDRAPSLSLPGPSSSGVRRARSLRLIASPVPAAWLSGCTAGAPSQADDDCPEPQEVLTKEPACCLVESGSLGLQLPPSSPSSSGGLSTRGGWSAAG